jgi:hypothetical protein
VQRYKVYNLLCRTPHPERFRKYIPGIFGCGESIDGSIENRFYRPGDRFAGEVKELWSQCRHMYLRERIVVAHGRDACGKAEEHAVMH